MSSSAVDICNLALSNLGDEAEVVSIVPPDGSIQAAQCGRFYPIARDVLLEMHQWTFATGRVSMALAPNAAPSEWAFAYAMPNGVLRPLAVFAPTAAQDGRGEDYIVEVDADGGQVVYTNVEDAVLRYVRFVTDTTKFTPGFTIALGRLLAVYLSGPLIKGSAGIQVGRAQLQQFAIELAQARSMDANRGQRSGYTNRVPDMVRAREDVGLLAERNGWNWFNA